jgi:thioredoxin 1
MPKKATAPKRASAKPSKPRPPKPTQLELRPTTIAIVTTARFQADVLLSARPVLLNVCAPWCESSQMLAPALEKVAREMGDRVTFLTMNADDAPGIATRYGVTGIPCLILFDGGHDVDRIVGAVPESLITAMLESHLATPNRRSRQRDVASPKPRRVTVTASHATRAARTHRPELEGVFETPEAVSALPRSAPSTTPSPADLAVPAPAPAAAAIQAAPHGHELALAITAVPHEALQRALLALLFREAGLDEPDEATMAKLCAGMRACGVQIVDSRAPMVIADVRYAIFPSARDAAS